MRAVFPRMQSPLRSAAFGLVLVAGLLTVAGCSKAKSPPLQTSTSLPETNPPVAMNPHATSTPATKAAEPLATPTGEPDMPALNRALLRWVLANRRPPANFADFSATAGVPIPPPPAGKKYVIAKDMHIVLVNQ